MVHLMTSNSFRHACRKHTLSWSYEIWWSWFFSVGNYFNKPIRHVVCAGALGLVKPIHRVVELSEL